MAMPAGFHVAAEYQPVMRELGLDAEGVFADPRIVVWRSIAERENCTLDAALAGGRNVRWHIKRHRREAQAAQAEAGGIRLLQAAGIRTTPLVGWGGLPDGRGFVITEDLAGFGDAEKLVREGVAFEKLLEPTADLAARLHSAGLHHRDLYLCHFFARVEADGVELALIDAARVRRLPRWPFRQRWIVKDLAQFWYSLQQIGVEERQRQRWLEHYARQRAVAAGSLLRSIRRKAAWIARHDQRLRQRQPERNVSIPSSQQ